MIASKARRRRCPSPAPSHVRQPFPQPFSSIDLCRFVPSHTHSPPPPNHSLGREYPGDIAQGGRAVDKANLLLLVQEFRVATEAEAAASGRARLLLSLAVAAGVGTIQNGYDIARLHQFVDWIGVMSYDLHGTFWPRRPYPPGPVARTLSLSLCLPPPPLPPTTLAGSWESFTGAHTALQDAASPLSVTAAVDYWLSGGMPPSKLVVGLATYGRSFTLPSTSPAGIGAPASGAGSQGPYTGTAGFLAWCVRGAGCWGCVCEWVVGCS